MADDLAKQIDSAFCYWWTALGENTPRPSKDETDDEYRRRCAHCAFMAGVLCGSLEKTNAKQTD